MSGFTTGNYSYYYILQEGPSSGQTDAIESETDTDSSYLQFDYTAASAGDPGTWYLDGGSYASQYTGYTVSGDPIIYYGGTYYLLTNTIQGTAVVPETNDAFTCYCGGTLILTERGEVAVEDLGIGDTVITADGGRQSIRWIGRRTIRTHGGRYPWADPLLVNPIRIRAGALGENLPKRDLRVSPEHAILIRDILVQAGALVNDVSILREDHLPEVLTYYHVELAEHALILAEGVAAESFVDNVNRLSFDNGPEHEAMMGGAPSIVEMAYPRAQSHRQVPPAIHAALMDRARALLGDLAA
jgi:hypothetical protein